MESSAQEIHENLNAVIDYQTHHRLRETQGRHRAEELNERIMIWSVFVTVAIFSVGFGQVHNWHNWLQLFYIVFTGVRSEIILRGEKTIADVRTSLKFYLRVTKKFQSDWKTCDFGLCSCTVQTVILVSNIVPTIYLFASDCLGMWSETVSLQMF